MRKFCIYASPCVTPEKVGVLCVTCVTIFSEKSLFLFVTCVTPEKVCVLCVTCVTKKRVFRKSLCFVRHLRHQPRVVSGSGAVRYYIVQLRLRRSPWHDSSPRLSAGGDGCPGLPGGCCSQALGRRPWGAVPLRGPGRCCSRALGRRPPHLYFPHLLLCCAVSSSNK